VHRLITEALELLDGMLSAWAPSCADTHRPINGGFQIELR
jgi:hypothetical protein